MKVKDEQQWSLQLKAFDQDETGKQFCEYLLFWVNTAERLMDESHVDDETSSMHPHEAMHHGLEIAEGTIGNIDAALYMGQMLAFIVTNWVHGTEFAEAMSNIELKLVASAVQERASLMQAMADQNAQVGRDL